MVDYAKARHTMVESQIRTVKVTDDRLIAALRATPREAFVPEHLKSIAYVDEDLRIKGDRYMTEPMVLARLLQAAEITPQDAALVVGCTTGYAVALVAALAETVVGVEDDAEMVASAERNLSEQGIDNTAVVQGVLNEGYPRQAPYDVILIEGRCGEIPVNLQEQLAPGGRMVTLTDERGVGKAVLLRRGTSGAVGSRILFDASVPHLRSFARESQFEL
jgi:protein-L-isoaspartate(D-aspartate) O-methyltransferase